MLRLILVSLLPLILHAAMKCEAGKCASDDSSMEKVIPKMTDTKTRENVKEKRQKKATVAQLFNVTTVQVKTMYSAKKQVNYGYIVAQDSRTVDVTAWFSGYVQTLYADTLYKKVKKGDALASVYSPEVYKAKQDYLNAVIFNAKKPAANMVKSARTKLVLLGVSHAEIDKISSQRTVSRTTTIHAPHAGWIFEKSIHQGSYINAKKTLFKITDLSQVWLEAKFFQNELSLLGTLENFEVHIQGIEKIFYAEKSLLYPMLDPKVATATLRLNIDNPNEVLKPGMYAKLHSSAKLKSRLVIPRTAAMRKNGTWYAFLSTEFKGEYEPIEIAVIPLDKKHFEVTKGLIEGDILVNNALFMMDSDAQINGVY